MIKILIFSLLTINIAFSSTVEECSNQLSSLGDGSGKSFVHSSCYEILKSKTNEKTIFTNEVIEIIAHKNSFYVKDLISNRELVTAGRFTELKNIIAMDYNEAHKEIAVLEKDSGDILFFSSVITGNVSAFRTIRTEQLVGASDLKVFKNEVYVLNSKDNTLLVYSRLANYFGRKDYKKLELLRSYNHLPTKSNSISLENNVIILLDKEGSKIKTNSFKN